MRPAASGATLFPVLPMKTLPAPLLSVLLYASAFSASAPECSNIIVVLTDVQGQGRA
jgi:hypothetical protein